MKYLTSAHICALAAAALLLPSCQPQERDPEKLAAMKQQNDELREEIAIMRARIAQAGEISPQLKEELDNCNHQIAQALNDLTAITQEETDAHARKIELENRLETLRDTFRQLQTELAENTPQP